ncbi:hypothetical protein [Frondihabitans cladoniiphilus]|uniref:Lipoprotein n=1 Tax=Frondihabitans cladoniiphilus TaxID=715785 RepID=A0ABP8WAS9_9MICO
MSLDSSREEVAGLFSQTVTRLGGGGWSDDVSAPRECELGSGAPGQQYRIQRRGPGSADFRTAATKVQALWSDRGYEAALSTIDRGGAVEVRHVEVGNGLFLRLLLNENAAILTGVSRCAPTVTSDDAALDGDSSET